MNFDLGKTKITEKIRVSSAAIKSVFMHGDYLQYETFIFSDDPKQKTKQIIHGTSSDVNNLDEYLVNKTKKIHNYISNNLFKRFKING